MKRMYFPALVLATTAFLSAGLAGCGNGSSAGDAASPRDSEISTTPPDTILGDLAADLGGVSAWDLPMQISHLSFGFSMCDDGTPSQGRTECLFGVPLCEDRKLPVVLTQDGTAGAGVLISYVFEDDPGKELVLSAVNALTDSEGRASVSIHRVNQHWTTVRLNACVAGAPGGPCLTFGLRSVEAGMVPLAVGFTTYDGAFKDEVTSAVVLVFKQDEYGKPMCADLNPDALPEATVSSPKLASLGQTAVFSDLPNTSNDETQIFTIVGLAMDDAGTVKAWACDDSDGIVDWCHLIGVDLVLVDLPNP